MNCNCIGRLNANGKAQPNNKKNIYAIDMGIVI